MRHWIPILTLLPVLGLSATLARPAFPLAQELEQTEGPLETAMLEIKGSIRALRRSLKKPELDAASFTSLTRMQTAIVQAKGQAPRMAAIQAPDQRPALLLAYRHAMIELLEASLVLERALIQADRSTVTQAFSDLRALEDPAHERFIEDE